MCPQARFVVMQRNPLELVAGLHARYWKNGMEMPDLAEAWWLQEARARAEALPRRFVHGRLHPYGRTAALRDTLAFLGVDDGGRTSFAPSLSHRSQRLQCGIGTLDRLASRPAAAVRLTDALRRVNTRQARRAVDAVLTVELHAHFRDDVGLLSEAMKRDLSSWMEGLSAREPGSAI